MPRRSGTCTSPRSTIRCGSRASITRPSKWITPCFGSSRPEIVRSVVDLPAPLPPISVTISPGSTRSDTPAHRLPNRHAVKHRHVLYFADNGMPTIPNLFCSTVLHFFALGEPLPQIRRDHFRIVLESFSAPLGDRHAVVEHRDPLANVHHESHVVLDQQDRHAEPIANLAESTGPARASPANSARPPAHRAAAPSAPPPAPERFPNVAGGHSSSSRPARRPAPANRIVPADHTPFVRSHPRRQDSGGSASSVAARPYRFRNWPASRTLSSTLRPGNRRMF